MDEQITDSAAADDETASGEPTTADLTKRLDDLAGQLAGFKSQIVEDLARVRKRVKGEHSAASAGEAEPAGSAGGGQPSLDRSEMDAMRRLMRLSPNLPPEVVDRIDKMVEDGATYQKAVELAEFATELVRKEPGAGSAPKPKPTGRAASAAAPNPSDGADRKTFAEQLSAQREKLSQA